MVGKTRFFKIFFGVIYALISLCRYGCFLYLKGLFHEKRRIIFGLYDAHVLLVLFSHSKSKFWEGLYCAMRRKIQFSNRFTDLFLKRSLITHKDSHISFDKNCFPHFKSEITSFWIWTQRSILKLTIYPTVPYITFRRPSDISITFSFALLKEKIRKKYSTVTEKVLTKRYVWYVFLTQNFKKNISLFILFVSLLLGLNFRFVFLIKHVVIIFWVDMAIFVFF